MNFKDFYKKKAVYKITINNKIYIGSSIDVYTRYKYHISFLKRNKHNNIYLQRAYNKYNDFKFEIIELYDNISRLELLKKEEYYMGLYAPHYNLMKTPILNKFSLITRRNISNSVKKAYLDGRLINPWSKNGKYIDIYNFKGDLINKNILVKDSIKILNVSNRSVINNAIRTEKYIIKDYIVVPTGVDMIDLIKKRAFSSLQYIKIYRISNNGEINQWRSRIRLKKKIIENNFCYCKNGKIFTFIGLINAVLLRNQ